MWRALNPQGAAFILKCCSSVEAASLGTVGIRHPLLASFVMLAACSFGCVSLAAQLVRESAPPQAVKPPTPGEQRVSQEIQLTGDQHWADTGIDIEPGERVVLTASGTLRYADAKQDNGPEGLPRAWMDLIRILPLNEAGRGALLGRIGDPDVALAFLIGAKRELQARTGGRLSIGINQAENDAADGTYRVRIEVYSASASAVSRGKEATARGPATRVAQIMGIDAALFKKIPRRITDKDGNPGDMVNFLILGEENDMQRAFQLAGWVKVDRTPKDAALHGLIASISKESYVQMPMSELYLFGRYQDYGYAHAEPIAMVARRHHLRLWKAPFKVNGQTLWVGAATHDIGFERDQRTNGITHKIDPNIDEEREYVGKTLSETGLVAEMSHFLPANPLKEARTATGGSFHSNGEVLILRLAEGGKDLRASFAETFCSVLKKEYPDPGDWGDCSSYLDVPSARTADLKPLPTNYRVLVIPGVLSSCNASTPAFAEGQKHLREVHGMTVDFLQLPNETSETNGQRIADYLRFEHKKDPRQFIVVAYSKGAPDVQEAFAADADAAAAVAAFVTVAGAVGGSPIANAMPAIAERYAASLKLGSCEGNVAEAFKSLRRDIRQRFLADHPDPVVPTFSLVAISDESNTSKMLREAWKLLAAYDKRQDSQLIQADAIVPGASFLGAARADHLAVALPFEFSSDESIRSAADRNHYPRVALFEALVRSAIQALPRSTAN
jgi:hypothetical protein